MLIFMGGILSMSSAIGGFMGMGSSAIGLMGAETEREDNIRGELHNQRFLEEQKEFSRMASKREMDLLRKEGVQLIGNQISAFGANGIDVSGSALIQTSTSASEIENELQAIREEHAFNLKHFDEEISASNSRITSLNANKGLKRFGYIMGGIGGMGSGVANVNSNRRKRGGD